MNTNIFKQIHIYASMFFLPMALLFAITGPFYILGYNQDYGMQKERYEILHNKPIENLEGFIVEFLKEKELRLPKDTTITQNSKYGTIMGSAKYFISIEQMPKKLILQTNTRSFYGNLVMLHKGKAGALFQAFNIIFALALFLFYFSGLVMTSWCKQIRKGVAISLILGISITLTLAYISL